MASTPPPTAGVGMPEVYEPPRAAQHGTPMPSVEVHSDETIKSIDTNKKDIERNDSAMSSTETQSIETRSKPLDTIISFTGTEPTTTQADALNTDIISSGTRSITTEPHPDIDAISEAHQPKDHETLPDAPAINTIVEPDNGDQDPLTGEQTRPVNNDGSYQNMPQTVDVVDANEDVDMRDTTSVAAEDQRIESSVEHILFPNTCPIPEDTEEHDVPDTPPPNDDGNDLSVPVKPSNIGEAQHHREYKYKTYNSPGKLAWDERREDGNLKNTNIVGRTSARHESNSTDYHGYDQTESHLRSHQIKRQRIKREDDDSDHDTMVDHSHWSGPERKHDPFAQKASEAQSAAPETPSDRVRKLEEEIAELKEIVRKKNLGARDDTEKSAELSRPKKMKITLRDRRANKNEEDDGDSEYLPEDYPPATQTTRYERAEKRAKAQEDLDGQSSKKSKKRTSNKRKGSKRKGSKAKSKSKPRRIPRKKVESLTEIVSNFLQTVRVGDDEPNADKPELPHFEAATKEEHEEKIKAYIKDDSRFDSSRIYEDVNELWNAAGIVRGALQKKVAGECHRDSAGWALPRMKARLYDYQLWGVGWMLTQERKTKLRGAILADDMGLGKTLTILALIAANRPSLKEKKGGTDKTLVVVPSNVLDTWLDEIESHCEKWRVIVFRKSKWRPTDELSEIVFNADIVLITYRELVSMYPSDEILKSIENLPEDLRTEEFNAQAGKIFGGAWKRVVFDEGHAMKNIKSRTSKACLAIGEQARHRWAVSGTPTPNGLIELVPYLKLIGAECPKSIKCFNKQREKQNQQERELALAELAPLIEKKVLQRTGHTWFIGRPLVKIPKPHQLRPEILSLSEEESHVYRHVERQMCWFINLRRLSTTDVSREEQSEDDDSDDDDAGKGKKSKTVNWALRLRQATAHLFLLEPLLKDFVTEGFINNLRRDLRKAGEGTQLIDNMSRLFKLAPDKSTDFSAQEIHIHEKPGVDGSNADDTHCILCNKPPTNPITTECDHTFCSNCLQNHCDNEIERGYQTPSCPVCGKFVESYKPDQWPAGNTTRLRETSASQSVGSRCSSELSEFSQAAPYKRIRKRGINGELLKYTGPRPQGADVNGVRATTKDECKYLKLCDKDPTMPFLPSTKLIAVKAIILNSLKDHPDDKLIGRMLHDEKIDFYYYYGCLDTDDKTRNIKDYRRISKAKVLLAGLKCGGQGLNLTCANRVIITDPWWNNAAERQAFCRVYRNKQEKETYLYRVWVDNTIDNRIMQLQKQKSEEIGNAFGEHDPQKQKLKGLDRLGLFGALREDENGRVVLEVDYDDNLEDFEKESSDEDMDNDGEEDEDDDQDDDDSEYEQD